MADTDDIILVGWEDVSDVRLLHLLNAVRDWKKNDNRWIYHETLCTRFNHVCNMCPNWRIKNINTEDGLCRIVRSRDEIDVDDVIELIEDEMERRENKVSP